MRFWIGLVLVLYGLGCAVIINWTDLYPLSDEPAYVCLAKSLATNGGYKDCSLPGQPNHTKYPILFPLSLALVWRQFPDFPSNVPFLRLVSVVFGIGSLIVWSRITRSLFPENPRWQVALLFLLGIHPAFLSCSVAVSSESGYLFFTLLAASLVLPQEPGQSKLGQIVLCTTSLGLAFYFRVVSLAFIGGIAADLFLKKMRSLAVLLVIASSLILPWLAWCSFHNDAGRFSDFVFSIDYASDFQRLKRTICQSLYLLARWESYGANEHDAPSRPNPTCVSGGNYSEVWDQVFGRG